MFKTIIIIIIAFFCCKIYITNKLNNFMNMVNDKVTNIDKNMKENFENKPEKIKIKTKKCDVFKPDIQIPKPIKKKICFNPVIEEVKQDNNYQPYNMNNCYNYLKLN